MARIIGKHPHILLSSGLFSEIFMSRPQLPPRIIHDLDAQSTGPLLIVLGGIHGNERAGVRAAERVLGQLAQQGGPPRGRAIALRGNRKALAHQERYLDQDLNRMWTASGIAALREAASAQPDAEQEELLDLLAIFRQLDRGRYSPKILLDLHTTSAPGGHFSVVADDELSIRLAATLQAPVITGLTKALVGTTASYCVDQGWAGLAFEAGQHHDPRAVTDHEAALWVILDWLDMVPQALHPKALKATLHLRDQNAALPPFVQVVYRHAITPEEGFRMRPGYINFQAVQKGEPLADDHHGPILAPASGLILMPLYQPQGADGFFIIQTIEKPAVNFVGSDR